MEGESPVQLRKGVLDVEGGSPVGGGRKSCRWREEVL